MVGICGAIGDVEQNIGPIKDWLNFNGNEIETEFKFDCGKIAIVTHPLFDQEQPIKLQLNDYLLWISGEVYGYQGNTEYTARGKNTSTIEFCKNVIDSSGIKAITRFNGEFQGILLNLEKKEVILFTDRLASRPIFFEHKKNGLIFSSNIQSLSMHPEIQTKFNEKYLFEYLAFHQTFGIKTPIENIEKLPPASISRYTISADDFKSEIYWRPKFEPKNKHYNKFLDDFIEIISEIITERVSKQQNTGLLLSGGSDSRLILASASDSLKLFHVTDWLESKETKIAQTAAQTTQKELELLERNEKYQFKALQRNPPMMDFISVFNQGHATGFRKEILSSVDALMSSQFCDTFLKGYTYPQYKLSVPRAGTTDVPFEKDISDIDEYINLLSGKSNDIEKYLNGDLQLEDILRENISDTGQGINHHGVLYPSIRDMILSADYYPLTNQPDFFAYNSLVQMMPFRSPILDNRLIDFHLSLPPKFALRKDIVRDGIDRLNSELADLPHSVTGAPLNSSFIRHYIYHKINWIRRNYINKPPDQNLLHITWTFDHRQFIRNSNIVSSVISDNRNIIPNCQILTEEGIKECYRDHDEGADRRDELYAVLTLLNTPIVQDALSD